MSSKKLCGIYSITCTTSGRVYVGQSVDIERRWRNHRSRLRSGKAQNRVLQGSWDKYGESSFKFEVVELVSREVLDARELHWISALNTLVSLGGMNISSEVDGSGRDIPPSKEARARAADSCSHRFTAFGKTQTLKQWSQETGVSVAALRKRLTKLGHPPEVAFSRPKNFGQVFLVAGQQGTLKQLSRQFNKNYNTVRNRITNRGWCPTKALLVA